MRKFYRSFLCGEGVFGDGAACENPWGGTAVGCPGMQWSLTASSRGDGHRHWPLLRAGAERNEAALAGRGASRVLVLKAQVGGGWRARRHGDGCRSWQAEVESAWLASGCTAGTPGPHLALRADSLKLQRERSMRMQKRKACSRSVTGAQQRSNGLLNSSSSGLESQKHHYVSHGLSCEALDTAAAASAALMEPVRSEHSHICSWHAQWVPPFQLHCWGRCGPASPPS